MAPAVALVLVGDVSMTVGGFGRRIIDSVVLLFLTAPRLSTACARRRRSNTQPSLNIIVWARCVRSYLNTILKNLTSAMPSLSVAVAAKKCQQEP